VQYPLTSETAEKITMGILENLPIMPLSSVLFPGTPTSLYIHEERYRTMLDECVDTGDGVFGVSLLSAGQEVGGTGIPHDIGTVAKIVAVTKLPDASSLVMARGGPRFRIRRFMNLKPVVEAEVEVLVDDPTLRPAERAMATEAHQQLEALVRMLLETMETEDTHPEVPEDPVQLSWAVAAHVQASLEVQQQLLEASTVGDRLAMAMPMLRQEVDHQRVILAARKRLDALGVSDDDAPFSRN